MRSGSWIAPWAVVWLRVCRILGLSLGLSLGDPRLAGASPLSDALARHADADVTALRARRGDAAARCTLGAIYARRNDLPRAALYLNDCEQATLPDDVAPAVARTAGDVRRRLDAGRYAALDVITQPEGLTGELDALPGDTFTTPATIWIEPGTHQVRVSSAERSWTQQVIAAPHKNTVVVIDTRPTTRPAPRPRQLDFTDDAGGAPGERHTGPPPDQHHPSLINDRYRGVPAPASEGPLDDPLDGPLDGPLAARDAPAADHRLWLGARLGAGMFDDGAATARAGLAVAAAVRYPLTDAAFAAGRADWSRRGGEVMTGTVDVLGASAGLGVMVLGGSPSSPAAPATPTSPSSPSSGRSAAARPAGLALAVIGQLRGDLRLTALRDTAPVRRAGLGIAAAAELALPAAPFTVGLRLEQGLTELVPGARDRAVLAEVGIDLR